MSNLKKGSFSLSLGFVQLSGDIAEDDRQCAWELYTEMSTRVAVVGKSRDPDCTNFDGELLIESMNSLYGFFQEARKIMRQFPVGKLGASSDAHLGVMIGRVMSEVIRPFLEKWHVEVRHWWEYQSNPRITPMDRQKEFPRFKELIDDWCSLRWLMRELQKELISVYRLTPVTPSL